MLLRVAVALDVELKRACDFFVVALSCYVHGRALKVELALACDLLGPQPFWPKIIVPTQPTPGRWTFQQSCVQIAAVCLCLGPAPGARRGC